MSCVVAGGSLVGLSAAIALARLGFTVTVAEQSPARAVDGGDGLRETDSYLAHAAAAAGR